METCIRCNVSGNKVRLFDAIHEGRMENVCERCAVIENIPIIKKPASSQLKESEGVEEVHNRMKRLSGMKEHKKEETFFPEDRLNELDKHPELELPEKEKLNLIEHFHWEIMKNRRRKGLSQKQLAETIGESEIAVQMIEKAKIPENAEILIKKLEQFFQTRLRKVSETEKILKQKQKKPVLLDERGQELKIIPEPELEKPELESEEDELFKEIGIEEAISEEEIIKSKEIGKPISKQKQISEQEPIFREDTSKSSISSELKNQESRIPKKPLGVLDKDFDIKKADLDSITISDLKRIHERKIRATRQERIEEQRKIEERQRILEAMRERDRIKQERKKEQKKMEMQKAEQEKQRLIEQRKEELRLIKEKESKEIDRFLGGTELLGNKEEKEIEDSEKVEEFDRELI